MKSKRTLLFRILTIAILAAIAAVMMVIGRGHTVYFDTSALDYEGKTYEAPYKIVVLVDGEQVAKLYEKERGMATCIGQKLDVTFEITETKGGEEKTVDMTIPVPYNMDGVIINLPGYLAQLPEEAYLTEFIPAVPEEDPADEELPTDEFGGDMALGDI